MSDGRRRPSRYEDREPRFPWLPRVAAVVAVAVVLAALVWSALLGRLF